MKILILACAAVVGIIQTTPTPKATFARLAQSTVRIRQLDGRGSGSGTIVKTFAGGALVLTCAHVVDSDPVVSVDVDEEGKPTHAFPGLVERVDHFHDLALVRTGDLGRPAMPIAEAEPEDYDELFVVAAPLAVQRQAAIERLSTKDSRTKDGLNVWTFTGQSIGGMSGSGLCTPLPAPTLVCVLKALATDGEHEYTQLGSCVPLAAVRAFLNGVQ